MDVLKDKHPDYRRLRQAMVDRQIVHRGVRAPLVLDAMRSVPREALLKPRLERAIGVIYRPEAELQSHYFEAVLPRQFDEYACFDQTCAVTPLDSSELKGAPDTYPFGI